MVADAALASTVILGLAGCEKEPEWKKHQFSSHNVKANLETELPQGLLHQIEGLLKAGGEKKEGGHEGGGGEGGQAQAEGGHAQAEGGHEGGEGSRAQNVLPSEFSPLKVYLIEKNKGILGNENSELQYGPGGGELDLRDYVAPKNGSFYFAVEFMPALEKAERKVYFLSNSVVRKLGGVTLGSGCEAYYDVTSAFKKAMSHEGFLVNTTGGRHVSALAGTYFFAAASEGKLYLARLTVRDSSQRSLQCHREAR
jgi:hypothetical protein